MPGILTTCLEDAQVAPRAETGTLAIQGEQVDHSRLDDPYYKTMYAVLNNIMSSDCVPAHSLSARYPLHDTLASFIFSSFIRFVLQNLK